jgi:ankyrin repeat protein
MVDSETPLWNPDVQNTWAFCMIVERCRLSRCATWRRREAVPTLLQYAIDNDGEIDEVGDEGKTLLLLAAEVGDGETVQVLVAAGANVDKPDRNGSTPLMAAAESGFASAVALLIAANAQVDAVNRYSQTAVYLAVAKGHTAIVAALIAAGADVNKSGPFASALAIAALNGRADLVRLLIDADARRDEALWGAAVGGNVRVVTLLLSAGVSREALTAAVHRALPQCDSSAAVALLIMAGADIDACADWSLSAEMA